MIPPRRVLEFLLGAACAVLIIAGMRSASGILNPMLMAGFLALLLQPLTRKLRRWGMAGGAAVALVVLSVALTVLVRDLLTDQQPDVGRAAPVTPPTVAASA